MKRIVRTCLSSLLTGALVLSARCVTAEEAEKIEFHSPFLLAEIVIPTQQDSGGKTAKSAAEVRGKARAYQESASGNSTIIVVPGDEDEGLLGPRRQPETGASQNRAKARQYQQGQGAAQVPIPITQDSGSAAPTTVERAQENRAKARSYVSSSDNTVVIERIGSDGIPIVSCGKLAANVAGRIGDDVQPGGIFFIMRDNKPFKVRCSQQ